MPEPAIDIRLNPFPWFRHMRQSAPVVWNEQQGTWSIFKYSDVQRALSDHALFSSQAYSGEDNPIGRSMINMDPPRHRQLRTLVSLAFTPRAVARLEDRITAVTHELLDAVEMQTQMDVIDDLAGPLPTIIIAEMLGIPSEDREKFKLWTNQLIGSAPYDGSDPQRVMADYYRQIFEARRREPRDDLVSALLEAQVDGEHLNETDLLGFCILLLLAGNETTTTLLGNALQTFDEHPEVMEELHANPLLLPGAIEEVRRYRSPVRLVLRATLQDVTLGGQRLPARSSVVTWLASANRDEEQFSHPDTFDIHRTPNRHLAFGYGIHFCLGAPLARLETRIALEAMLSRWTNIRRANQEALEPLGSFVLLGLRHLPIVFCRR
ncbi:MAG TPA: cytochrome P450 [Ktedonobacteraceae bacterium]|jgi:cytochrome P450